MQADAHASKVGLGRKDPRLLVYCGPGGKPVEEVMARAAEVTPRLAPAVPPLEDGSNRLVGLLLVNDSVPLIATTTRPDGSFAVIDGRFIHPTTSLDQVLDDWLADGDITFNRYPFLGLIAVWSPKRLRCVVARGTYGAVPGYTALTGRGVLFSTDQATLLDHAIDRTPDIEAIDAFLATGHFPAPLTPLSAVSKVPPGSLVSVTPEGVGNPQPWYVPPTAPTVPAQDAVEVWRKAMAEAIDRLWPEDGDVGLLLSGGIDSAIILSIAAKEQNRPIRAFTFQYEDYEGRQNEVGPAKAVADHLGTPHELIPIRPQEILRDLDGAVAAYDEPFTWGFHSYQLDPVVDRGITALYSGLGAEGAAAPRRHQAAMRFGRLPKYVRSPIRASVRAARRLHLGQQPNAEWVTRAIAGPGELYCFDSGWKQNARHGIYNDPALVDRASQRLVGIYEAAAQDIGGSSVTETLYLLDKRFASAETMQQWTRAWTLANGLEICMPFYDHDFISVASNIEGGTSGKLVSRQAATKYLPEERAFAPRLAQQMPVGDWLRGPLSEAAYERLSDLPDAMTEHFDRRGVLALLNDHVRGRADHGWLLVALLTTSSWFRQLST